MATIDFGTDCGTFYSSYAQASAIASALAGDFDDGWTYEVVEAGRYFKVSVTDDEGDFVAFFTS